MPLSALRARPARSAFSRAPRGFYRLVPLAVGALMLVGVAPAANASARNTKHSGSVAVYYAASLQSILENSIAPAFHRATGYTFTGFAGGSGTLANEIKAGVSKVDVFISAAETTNLALEGPANGSWVSSFVVWGKSPLVLGYARQSSFAPLFKKMPWYSVLQQPGIRIGRTDPAVDPKGKLTTQAITAAAQIYNRPSIGAVISSPTNIYPEQTLVGLLEAGQLDVGFFYTSETKAAGIPTISLGQRIPLAATYTLALLKNAPDSPAAVAFADFLLGPVGSKILRREGITTLHPKVVGPLQTIPASLRRVIAKS